MIAKVSIPLKIDKLLDYKIPDYLEKKVKKGVRVLVPLLNKIITGFVIDIIEHSEFEKLKKVYDVIDKNPILTDEIIEICYDISKYYVCDFSICLKASIPAFSLFELENIFIINKESIKAYKALNNLSKNREELLLFLEEFKKKRFLKNRSKENLNLII
jgi:primosomal protein N' (replication factor Y)